jgi:hypothetical protein
MKNFARTVGFLFITAALTVSIFAQNKESKDETYSKIAKLTQTKKSEDADKAYLMSKDFLAKYGKDDDDKTKKIKAFSDNYRNNAFNKKLDETKTAEAFAIGKEILTQEPENTYVTMNLAYAGFDAMQKNKDKAFGADATAYAKQTLSLLDAGKLPKTFQPFKDQTEATAFMYYVIGNFAIDSDLKAAAQNFYKAAGYTSKIKTDSFPYYVIAAYYEKEYARQATDFQSKYGAKTTEDAEMKAANAKIEKLIGNMLDAYTRAIKFGEAEKNANLAAWKQRFTDIYKFLKKSDAGMSEYLASEPNIALPDPSAL